MNQNPRLLTGPETLENGPLPFGPVLIEVPALDPRLRAGSAAQTRPGVRRRRRRLRREIRMAGSALMVGMPLTWAVLSFCGDPPEPPAVQPRLMGVEGVPASFIAIDGATWGRSGADVDASAAQVSDDQSPVVFPGYVLPEDGCEEPAHAGG